MHSEVPQHDQHLPKPLARLLQIHPRNLSRCRSGTGGRLKALPKMPFLQVSTAGFGCRGTRTRRQGLRAPEHSPALGRGSPEGRQEQPAGIQRGLTGSRLRTRAPEMWKRRKSSGREPQALARPCPVDQGRCRIGAAQHSSGSREGFGEHRRGQGWGRPLWGPDPRDGCPGRDPGTALGSRAQLVFIPR